MTTDLPIPVNLRESLVGKTFGRLKVVSYAGVVVVDGIRKHQWECVCSCGTSKIAGAAQMRSGGVRSCGCLAREVTIKRSTKHGDRTRDYTAREYRIYRHMIDRCHAPSSHAYHHYGGRGITVCDRWRNSYIDFLSDMGRCPEGMSIDRIDNNQGYSKSNCRWATSREQMNNRRNNVNLRVYESEASVSAWSRVSGTKDATIRSRIELGWSARDAVFGAVDISKRSKKQTRAA